MFTVVSKSNDKCVYIAYGVKHKKDGNTLFLIWDNEWEWLPAEWFEPAEKMNESIKTIRELDGNQ